MNSLLRSLIRETLLLEEVYGAQATVYHGTKTDPRILVPALLNDEFVPGRGAGSLYGKGLYTVYETGGTPTMTGAYGDWVIKLKVNLWGYVIFDPEIALKVYGKALSPVAQAKKIGYSKNIVESLKNFKFGKKYSSDVAEDASEFLRGQVKGIVFTGRNDGRVAVIYDPATAVPIAWKRVSITGFGLGAERKLVDEPWTLVDKEKLKKSLRRSASHSWKEEKYEITNLKLLRALSKLPIEKRIVTGNLDLGNTSSSFLPDGLQVRGYLIVGKQAKSLPQGLKVGGELDIENRQIDSLPDNLEVGGSLYMRGTPVKSLPSGLRIGKDLYLHRTLVTSIPDDLQIAGTIRGFNPNYRNNVPNHLKGKLELT
jgi:hypothetical protein